MISVRLTSGLALLLRRPWGRPAQEFSENLLKAKELDTDKFTEGGNGTLLGAEHGIELNAEATTRMRFRSSLHEVEHERRSVASPDCSENRQILVFSSGRPGGVSVERTSKTAWWNAP